MTMENESSISLGWGQNFQTPTAVKKTGPAYSFTWKIGWGGGKISVWSLIYSIVQKRHKENPDQVNGDY